MSSPSSVLSNVQIASPCSASWENMAGDDQARFCVHCKLHVYNLSSMSKEEAERLLNSYQDDEKREQKNMQKRYRKPVEVEEDW